VCIPSLIVSPGYSCFTDDTGMNHQTDITKSLERYGRLWGIPVVIVPEKRC
jgi:hypothetical protein